MINSKNSDYFVVKVQGGSMYPLLHTGDLLFIKKELKIKKGDIITFLDNGYVTSHRVIKVKPRIITKGDNSPWYDNNQINTENILGIAVLVFKEKTKEFYSLSNTKINRGFVLYGLIEIFIIDILKRLLKNDYTQVIKKKLYPIYYGIIAKKYNNLN